MINLLSSLTGIVVYMRLCELGLNNILAAICGVVIGNLVYIAFVCIKRLDKPKLKPKLKDKRNNKQGNIKIQN